MGAADFGVGMSSSTTLDVKAGSGGTILFKQASATKMILSTGALTLQTATTLDVGDQLIDNVGKILFGLDIPLLSTEPGIIWDGANIIANVGNGDGHVWKIENVQKFGIGVSAITADTLLDMNNNNIDDIQLLIFNDGGNIEGTSSAITVNTSSLARDFIVDVAGTTFVTVGDDSSGFLEIRDTTVNIAPELRLYNDSSASDGDTMGIINFNGNFSGAGVHNYAQIEGIAEDVTSGTTDGSLKLFVKAGGGNTAGVWIRGSNSNLQLGFRGATPQTVATISGNTSTYVESILTSLLSALDAMGLIIDNTTT
jgi:hypothetical protein